ncbi:hypothetical protein [Acidithiobacillus sulfuriphilus]|uniref:hypothetical protein n=1 Tax=Acidithiobacillus sulfuriphilus TaxID=1867749 RepID=UPI003F6090DA
MTVEPTLAMRLQFLVRVVRKECQHLSTTDQRLFASAFTSEQAALGDKPSAAMDNLDRAERLGFIQSADEWMTMRKLRNQMVHEYVEDPAILTSALQTAHAYVPTLIAAAKQMTAEIERRVWA